MTTVAPAAERAVSRPPSNALEPVDIRWMVGLGSLALVLRLWFVLSVGQTQAPIDDAGIYNAIAVNLAHGHGFSGVYGQPTAEWPPGYPFLLSLIYRIFGTGATSGAVLNAILGAATVPLLYLTTRRGLGRVEAVIVGGGMALLLGQVFWTDILITETAFVFLLAVLLAVLTLVSPTSARSALLVGGVLGATALTRGEGIALLVIPLAMWWPELPRRLFFRQAAILVAVILAFVIPWTIRNAVAMHAFVPISTNFGSTFWGGHNPLANGGPTLPPTQLLDQVKPPVTSPDHELQLEALLRRRALSWMVSHPVKELELIPLKLLALVSGDGQTIVVWIDHQAELSPSAQGRLAVLADIESYGLLVGFLGSLIVYGRALWRRRRLLRGALAYISIALLMYGFVFYGSFRYRAPLEPLMLLVAAPLFARLWALRAQRLA